jgi:hypothetical protein
MATTNEEVPNPDPAGASKVDSLNQFRKVYLY